MKETFNPVLSEDFEFQGRQKKTDGSFWLSRPIRNHPRKWKLASLRWLPPFEKWDRLGLGAYRRSFGRKNDMFAPKNVNVYDDTSRNVFLRNICCVNFKLKVRITAKWQNKSQLYTVKNNKHAAEWIQVQIELRKIPCPHNLGYWMRNCSKLNREQITKGAVALRFSPLTLGKDGLQNERPENFRKKIGTLESEEGLQ